MTVKLEAKFCIGETVYLHEFDRPPLKVRAVRWDDMGISYQLEGESRYWQERALSYSAPNTQDAHVHTWSPPPYYSMSGVAPFYRQCESCNAVEEVAK
jgi:hypothetical protein